MNIVKTKIPENSLAQQSFKRIDYMDAYTCHFQTTKEVLVDDLVYAFFDSAPQWIEKLFSFRNKVVSLFGLKTSTVDDKDALRKNFKVEKGYSLGLFKIVEKTFNEVLMGEDDKHLNFRISFFLVKNDHDHSYSFTLSTTVMMNNWLGKIYFLPVKPFHSLIVPGMMKSIVKHVTNNK